MYPLSILIICDISSQSFKLFNVFNLTILVVIFPWKPKGRQEVCVLSQKLFSFGDQHRNLLENDVR